MVIKGQKKYKGKMKKSNLRESGSNIILENKYKDIIKPDDVISELRRIIFMRSDYIRFNDNLLVKFYNENKNNSIFIDNCIIILKDIFSNICELFRSGNGEQGVSQYTKDVFEIINKTISSVSSLSNLIKKKKFLLLKLFTYPNQSKLCDTLCYLQC